MIYEDYLDRSCTRSFHYLATACPPD